jgi:peptidoglycan/LPS O-acetylase OafA/YrhL
MNKNYTYRRDIDGLRALAIIFVIIFHFVPSLIPVGYIGVDIFFVISGFLITRIILEEFENNEFSYQKFYIRRIRRIFPALFFMLFCSFVAAFLMLGSGDMTWFAKAMHYSSLQISNLFFQRVTDYFNQGRDHFAPLLHTWSLGVEEQFYLLVPVIIASLLKWKKDKKFPFFALLFLSIISICLSQYLLKENQKIAFFSKENQKIAFFSIASRFFELGIGCLLAFYGKKNLSAIVSNFTGIAGIAVISSSFFLINYTNFPGFAALLPCLGAALIILAGSRSENLISRILSNFLPVFIGKISYSLYLWHLPLIVF